MGYAHEYTIMRTTRSIVMLALAMPFMALTAAAEDRPPIGTKTGEMYPDFVLPTLDGEIKRLSDFRGKRILLFHFASW